jgi:hypothetical protein
MKIQVFIPTYNRPEMLARLRDDIRFKGVNYDIWQSIFEDTDTAKTEESGNDYTYYMLGYHYGKKAYWQMWNYIFDKVIDADYYIFLADDFQLSDGFFDKAIQLYESIKDDKKICLSLYMPKGREGKPNWTGVVPLRYNDEILKTQWNDLCFIAERKFFEALGYKINPIGYKRWVNNPLKSSGVGEQISYRLHNAGYSMYHVKESLVTHGNHLSVMNPEERKINPLL